MSGGASISTINAKRYDSLRYAPIVPTLLRLSLPNFLALGALLGASIIETIYVAYLGQASLAAMAIVFPIVVLHNSLSIGAFGGGISSALARTLGEGHEDRAQTLAWTALSTCLFLGSATAMLMLWFANSLTAMFEVTPEVQDLASSYLKVVFSAAPIIWLTNGLLSIIRGSGNMKLSSLAIVLVAVLQVSIGASLGLGLGPVPRLGMVGVALGQVIAYFVCGLTLLYYLTFAGARLKIGWTGKKFDRIALTRVLRVGLVSCIAPIQTNLTIVLTSALLARHGTTFLAGYGVGARLETLLVNLAFAFGSASVPLVGTAVGANDWVRAQKVCWAAGIAGAVVIGTIGCIVCLEPFAWYGLFPLDKDMREIAGEYLRIVGPAFGFFGLGLCLFFASQGTGRVAGTVLAGTLRLALVAGAGAWLSTKNADPRSLFILVAIGMVLFGASASLATALRKSYHDNSQANV